MSAPSAVPDYARPLSKETNEVRAQSSLLDILDWPALILTWQPVKT